MPSRATERVDAARRPTNASVAVVASAEKDTAPGHLAASPLRDRTNVQAAAAEASPSSDAVAESEEEEDSAPARSRRPFGVPVGAANRAVLEQMLRREAPRSALTRVSPEASPSGRSGAAEPPRSDASPVEPHRRESRRKRRRRRSPCGSREEDAVEEEDASRARRGKRRNAPGSPSAFEVADGAGDVSEHSDASHDRTAGVRGYNFQELRGDAYGRGRRRGNGGDANRVARRIAERRECGGRALRRFSSDSDSDSDTDSGSDDASPLEDEDVRARRVVAADVGDGDGQDRVCFGDENALLSDDAPRDADDAFHPRLAEEAPRRRIATQTRLDQWVPRRDPRDVSRILVTAEQFSMRSRGDRRRKQNAVDDDETRRRSARKKQPLTPWAFPATTDAFDGALRAAARAANDAFRRSPQDSNPDGLDGSCASDPTTLVRVAARLFRAHASCANHSGAPRDMSPADLAAWTRAARACERERPGSGKGVFWRVVAACAAETRRGVEDEEDTGDDVSEDEDAVGHETRHDSRHLCALEASWELIFVAARAWRSAETDDSDDGAAGLRGATRPPLARSNGVETSWAEPAWRAVSDLLEASPLEENEKIAEAAAARVAALAKAWPRCAATAAPAWEIWRRVGRLGKPPTGAGKEGLATTREGGANAGGPRGEYPAEAVAAAAAAAAAAEARFAFVGETSATGAASAAAASSAAASRAARFFSCSCCEIPPPSSARPASGASLGCLVPAATSACASALDALAAHVGAASDARDVRRDLGKVLSAAAFVFASKRDDEKTTQVSTTTRKENETVAGKQQTNGTLSSSQTSRFRAFGGASAPCTAHSAAVRHRAATHARLMGVCLEHGMPDQAGACLRQMRAALAPGRLPSAARDPAPLAAAARAVRVAAEAWLACARRRGKEAFKSDKGADLLAKEGEAAIDTLFAAAAEAGAETRVGVAGETSESRESSQTTELPVPGTDLARRAGIVVAEAAAAAATTYAALVASGARPEGAAETQTRFCAFLCLPRSARDTRDSWPSRVFALRALAALLVPNTWLSLETSACSSAESLVPALAAWAASAASDAAAGGVGPLAAALFKHPRLSRLNEGAAAGDADAAEAVARLQRGSGVFGTRGADTDRDDNQVDNQVPESSAAWVTWRALRGGDSGGSFSTEPPRSFSGFFFGGGAAAEAARSHARERAAAACVGGVPGDAMGAHEAAFRASAGALVGAQIAECGAAGAAAIATLVAQFPAAARKRAPGFLLETKTDHPSFLDGTFNGRRSRTADGVFGVFGGTAKTHHSTTRDVDDSRRLEAEASARRAHAVSVAGAARWLAEAAARTAAAWPPSIDSKAAPRSSPALAVIAGAGGASFRASPAFDLLRRDGRAGETARLAFAAAAARWTAARAARTAGDRDGDGDGDEIWDAAFAAATRDLAACTVGVLEWTLGEDEEDGDEAAGGVEGTMLDALAFALADERFEASSAAAAAAVLSRLVPRFLAAETRQAPQRRCARVWLSALALCRRLLAREDEARAVDASETVSQGSRAAHSAAARRRPNANARNAISAGLFSDTLSTPGVMLLDAVANENEMGGDMRHQAAAAVADLIGLVAERLDVASGVAAARAAPAAATTAPPPRAPATRAPATRAPAQPAPAPSSGYFPFPGTAFATAAAAARDEAAERDAARASAAAALEEARLRERRARDSAEARMAASASLRSAAAAASLSAAASASLASPAAARLLGACATFAVASLASAALAASAAATTASRAFVSLGARRGGGGGAREEDSDRARAREVSHARAALVLALERAKARLAAEAREVSRYDFSGAGVDPVAGGSSSRCANLALADLGAAVGFFPAGDQDPEVKPNASATGSSAFWGCAPVPPGSHRAPASWSAASPEERSAKLARSAAAFLLALARRCEVSSAPGNDSSSEEARGFFASRRNRGDEDVFASLLAPHLETLARAASLLGEAFSRDDVVFLSSAGDATRGARDLKSNPREVSALLAETLRLRRVAVPRLPSSSSFAPSRVSGRGNGPNALAFGGRGRGARGRGRGGASRGV